MSYGLGIVRPRRLNLRRALADGYVMRAGTIGELGALLEIEPPTSARAAA